MYQISGLSPDFSRISPAASARAACRQGVPDTSGPPGKAGKITVLPRQVCEDDHGDRGIASWSL
ncbi:hypothetical protein [Methanoregula boonei]|uniref:hypothetical protein n=1 Tax=Methanoregula boonei TaxID=358766 RepID=UPI00064F28DD|nr:hypothetical protein [Methanoregula boonei]